MRSCTGHGGPYARLRARLDALEVKSGQEECERSNQEQHDDIKHGLSFTERRRLQRLPQIWQ